MNGLFIFSVMLLLVGIEGGKLLCTTDLDCKKNECCVMCIRQNATVCKEMGDGNGDLCGGQYFCPQCRGGLICTQFSVDSSEFQDEQACQLPANGSCRHPVGEAAGPYLTGGIAKLNSTSHRSCATDADCRWKECCAKSFDGQGNVCRNIGGDYGDSCGGDYFCNSCRKGLVCTPSVTSAAPRPTAVPMDYFDQNSTEQMIDTAFDDIFFNESESLNDSAEIVCLPPANGTCRYPAASSETLPLCHIGFKRPCYDDSDCKTKECCAMHFNGRYKVCRSKSGNVGDSCGGDYFCPECRRNLQCVDVTFLSKAPESYLPETTSVCPTPSNGTCQYLWTL